MFNEHITSLGYRLEHTEAVDQVTALLEACRLSPIESPGPEWEPTRYIVACTLAGGTAACIGWNRRDDAVVLHSLGVAPTSRGSGIGAGLLASAMGHIMDTQSVPETWLITDALGARRMFTSAGFVPAERSDVPSAIADHPTFRNTRGEHARPMVRRYQTTRRGLDNCAFRLILNETDEATLPLGSVFFFRQTGEVIEASYRGGPVRRGHLIGAISGDELNFCWHHYVDDGRLQNGDGRIFVEMLEDGRRELRENLDLDSGDKNELLLREV